MTEEEPVTLRMDGQVAVVSLNRPHRHNAANDAMDQRFFEILEELHADAQLRCVVIRGEGKSLSSGRDTAELGVRAGDESHLEFIERGHGKTRLLWSLPCPTIVAMKGWIIGGWFERSLLCDIRIASSDAKMSLPEVVHGVVPDTGGTSRLAQIAGSSVAFDLALTGRHLTAAEALSHGIVSRVVELAEIDDVVMEMAHAIATRPPLAVKFVKRVLNGLSMHEVERSMNEELLSQVVIYSSDDYVEQRQAREENRTPTFRGR